MSEFKLDTSGIVDFHVGSLNSFRMWKDLSPFEQGYVEGMLTEKGILAKLWAQGMSWDKQSLAFSDLAPETMERIREDCARWCVKVEEAYAPFASPGASLALTQEDGRNFWEWQQSKERFERDMQSFPPLTVYLSDDGKVCFR